MLKQGVVQADDNKLDFVSSSDLDLEAQPLRQDVPVNNSLSGRMAAAGWQSAHPIAAFFHVAFKVVALTVYLLCGFFTSNFVLVFVILVLLLAFDFWTVKNITGRLLVGLRWWNNIKEDGTSEWVFESHEGTRDVHPTDYRVFWGALFGTPIIWALLSIVAALKFNLEWLVIIVVALALSGANAVGYVKCSNGAKAQLQQAVTTGAMNAITGGLIGRLSGAASSGSR